MVAMTMLQEAMARTRMLKVDPLEKMIAMIIRSKATSFIASTSHIDEKSVVGLKDKPRRSGRQRGGNT